MYETLRLLAADELLTQYDANRKKNSKTRRKLCSNRLQSAAELCQRGEIFRRHQHQQTPPQVNPANSAKFQWRGRLIFVYNQERERRLTTDQKTHSKKKCATGLNSWRNESRFMEFSGDFTSDLDSNFLSKQVQWVIEGRFFLGWEFVDIDEFCERRLQSVWKKFLGWCSNSNKIYFWKNCFLIVFFLPNRVRVHWICAALMKQPLMLKL